MFYNHYIIKIFSMPLHRQTDLVFVHIRSQDDVGEFDGVMILSSYLEIFARKFEIF